MFPENDIERDKYDKFRDEFSREDDKFLLIYSCDDPLSKKNINKLKDVTDELEWIDGIEGIITLSNIENGELFDTDLNDSVWAHNKQFVLSHPIYTDLVISGDGKSGAIFADLEDDINNQFEREKVFRAIDGVLAYHRDWEWHEAGMPVMRTRYVELVSKERSIFIPVGVFVIIMILFFIFRQVHCVVLSTLSIFITLIWVSALMAFCGISINLISYLTFILIIPQLPLRSLLNFCDPCIQLNI